MTQPTQHGDLEVSPLDVSFLARDPNRPFCRRIGVAQRVFPLPLFALAYRSTPYSLLKPALVACRDFLPGMHLYLFSKWEAGTENDVLLRSWRALSWLIDDRIEAGFSARQESVVFEDGGHGVLQTRWLTDVQDAICVEFVRL